ncbi:sensor histidine kinase [Nocardia asteroides]|uniref:sensor histidine kinase n=1 Tax=Nocardia asteroides TaxID=1824 RepID=UPI001E2FC999|nr:sensor histidine kinase [Nocardia asteroides]UGT57884.1 sensor histidine kinase [Nocardia asteroides]
MNSSPLTPVVTTLRLGLHVLVTVLAVVVAVRALLPGGGGHGVLVVGLTIVWLVVYFAGTEMPRRSGDRRVPDSVGNQTGAGRTATMPTNPPAPVWSSWSVWVWLASLTALWLALLALTPDAVYLAFGLFFVYLHLLPRPWSLLAVVLATAVGVAGFAAHRGWSVGAVVGPVLGAAVAIGIGLGYQALHREAVERERLIDELLSTRAVLAERERTAGKLAERERLAKEIHDTVAQGLSSIQLLLHAAEQAAPDHPALDRIQLARETAAADLAETRRLIDELAPAALDGQSLAEALERICERANSATLATQLLVEGEPERLPMPVEAALVRIARSAVANVVQHADAARMRVTLTYDDTDVHLDIVDDGIGIDAEILRRPRSGAFGLAAMRSRVEQQGGRMTIESEPGHTAVTVSFPLGAAA